MELVTTTLDCQIHIVRDTADIDYYRYMYIIYILHARNTIQSYHIVFNSFVVCVWTFVLI